MKEPAEVSGREENRKTFKLLRYFSFLSAIAFALAIASLVVLYRHFAVKGIILLAERQNELLAHMVSGIIWPRFGGHLAAADGLGGDALRAHPETGEINKMLGELAKGLPIIKVKVYSLDGHAVFSTEADDMGKAMGSHVQSSLLALRGGRPMTFLGEKEKFNSISGMVFNRVIAESYVPVQRRREKAEAIFEMYTDVTAMMSEVDSNSVYFLVGLFISFGSLYGGLFLIVRRADGILHSQAKALEQMAYSDALTGLANRPIFHESLTQALLLAKRRSAKVAVLYFDLNDFKRINDSYGHAAGDEVLRAVAQRVRARLRESDLVARLGGDEFAAILSDVERGENAAAVSAKIIEDFKKPYAIDGIDHVFATSIGISIFPDDGADAESLVRRADMAMYHAKGEKPQGSAYKLFDVSMEALSAR